jgi:hypothetical protein
VLTDSLILLTGLLAGAFVSFWVIRRSKTRWVLVGQRSGEAMHDRTFEGWNRTELPRRPRSPDHQLVDRRITPTREQTRLPR